MGTILCFKDKDFLLTQSHFKFALGILSSHPRSFSVRPGLTPKSFVLSATGIPIDSCRSSSTVASLALTVATSPYLPLPTSLRACLDRDGAGDALRGGLHAQPDDPEDQ